MGWETDSGEDNSQCGAGGLQSHCRCSDGKEDKSPRTRMSLREKKTNQTPAAACNIKEWMQGIEEDDSEVQLRDGRAGNCRAEPRNAVLEC